MIVDAWVAFELLGLGADRYPAAQGRPVTGVDMYSTCGHHRDMPTMIQIRNVPDALHRQLKSRAALAGQSLSDYLLRQVGEIAARPTREELMARLKSLPPVELTSDPVDILREERERR